MCDYFPKLLQTHFLFCKFFAAISVAFSVLVLHYRLELLNDICDLNESLKNFLEENLLKILLYGTEDFTSQKNSEILKRTIKFIKNRRFSGSLYLS